MGKQRQMRKRRAYEKEFDEVVGIADSECGMKRMERIG